MKAVVLLCLVAACAAYVTFDNHSVLRLKLDGATITPAEREAVRLLHEGGMNLDWWSDTDIRVSPEQREEVTRFLAHHRIEYETMIENVQALVDAENHWHAAQPQNLTTADLLRSTAGAPPDFFKDYRKLEDIIAFADGLVQQYPQLARKVQLGTSYENRPIWVYVVASNKSPKQGIYYEGGIHAREWVAHTTVSYILWSLLSGYGTDATATKLVDSFTWHLVPALNVDGYVYTWNGNRMWRKTRSPNQGSTCIGTDPNRNWDNHWCQQGADRNPCSDSFCGRAAFSEKETKAAADYIKANSIRGMIDFHSYSQLWMRPYGWTSAQPKDAANQRALGQLAVAAIQKNGGKVYREGSIYTIIYPASGSSADWGYDSANCTYGYGVELRDTGQYGFLLPASQIVPTGVEIWAAVVEMGNYIATH